MYVKTKYIQALNALELRVSNTQVPWIQLELLIMSRFI